MLNLMSNAVNFNEPGGQVIVSTAMNETGQAVIRVRDTGIGMSETELGVALEAVPADFDLASDRGTGLGLPLTKALVEANRAGFSIKSRKEQGTLVGNRIPDRAGGGAIGQGSGKRGPARENGATPRILHFDLVHSTLLQMRPPRTQPAVVR